MCITSPPYWRLRDYSACPHCEGCVTETPLCENCNGTGRLKGAEQIWGGDPNCDHAWVTCAIKGQSGGPSDKQLSNAGSRFDNSTCSTCSAWFGSLGLESTPELFIEHLVMIFREVRRVLRDDGTLWVNIGDSYANDSKWGGESGGKQAYLSGTDRKCAGRGKRFTGLKSKDLIGVPWMLAFALRADGWYLRSANIWQKPNVMPGSQQDRPTCDYEYVFLLSKSSKYFYDNEAVKQPALSKPKKAGRNSRAYKDRDRQHGTSKQDSIKRGDYIGFNERYDFHNPLLTRTLRTTWTIPTQPSAYKHFAMFPERLAEIPILAGTSEHGCCAGCGTPHTRIFTKQIINLSNAAIAGTEIVGKGHPTSQIRENHDIRDGPVTITQTTGWYKQCQCETEETISCTVLDPFSGAATSGLVALKLGRQYIGIEQNELYNRIAEERLINADLDVIIL